MSYITNSLDERVVELLGQGSIGFMPSDTIYGLSCAALNEAAVIRLHRLKGRAANKPFIILVSDIEMLNLLSISEKQLSGGEKYWPGSLTLVCDAPKAPSWLLLGGSSLAVRVPGNTVLREFIKTTGPIVSTSANKNGEEPAVSATSAQDTFGNSLDFYVDVGEVDAKPSTIARIVDGELKQLRAGAVKINEKEKL